MKILLVILLLMTMTLSGTAGAFAEVLELTGSVAATRIETLTAPAAGKVESCSVAPGDHVEAGTALLSLQTTKVYAEQDGTVRVFGRSGDSLTTLTTRYGGVVYIEPAQRYTISASTKGAYNNDDNKRIHAGEVVHLRATNNIKLTTVGRVTSVSGTSYKVEVDGNVFTNNTAVSIYREMNFVNTSLIGTGKVAQTSAVVYGGTGYLVKMHVKSGQEVSAGDLLYETLEGDFAPGTLNLNQMTADQPGVIASVSTNKGGSVAAGDAVIEFYPDAGLRIAVSVPEGDLSRIQTGMTVQLLLPGDEDSADPMNGTVEKISLVPDADAVYGATYTVYIIPGTLAALRYGMTVTVLIP